MTPTVVETAPVPTAQAHLTAALGQVDRLIRIETNRSKHVALQHLRLEITTVIAHLVSEK